MLTSDSPADDLSQRRAERMSAWADGEVGTSREEWVHAWRGLAQEWAAEPELRTQWATYQLIGDVLRSADLAHCPAGDATLFNAVRARLKADPSQDAPESTPALESSSRSSAGASGVELSRAASRLAWGKRWSAPLAAAAGVMMVIGLASQITVSDEAELARSAQVSDRTINPDDTKAASVAGLPSGAVGAMSSPEWQRYVAAHRSAGMGNLVPVQSVAPRAVYLIPAVAERREVPGP